MAPSSPSSSDLSKDGDVDDADLAKVRDPSAVMFPRDCQDPSAACGYLSLAWHPMDMDDDKFPYQMLS